MEKLFVDFQTTARYVNLVILQIIRIIRAFRWCNSYSVIGDMTSRELEMPCRAESLLFSSVDRGRETCPRLAAAELSRGAFDVYPLATFGDDIIGAGAVHVRRKVVLYDERGNSFPFVFEQSISLRAVDLIVPYQQVYTLRSNICVYILT